ncbi:unnamed protein product, partial [marine sediment metagenome]
MKKLKAKTKQSGSVYSIEGAEKSNLTPVNITPKEYKPLMSETLKLNILVTKEHDQVNVWNEDFLEAGYGTTLLDALESFTRMLYSKYKVLNQSPESSLGKTFLRQKQLFEKWGEKTTKPIWSPGRPKMYSDEVMK